jgi:C-terminal processing protease CtpA/Prc
MKRRWTLVAALLSINLLVLSACQGALLATEAPTHAPTEAPTGLPPTAAPTQAPPPTTAPTSPPETVSQPTGPYRVTGSINVTNPFVQYDNAEPFVLLEDETGFVARDFEHHFSTQSQVLGHINIPAQGPWTYELNLPAQPDGPYVDVDNNGQSDQGVQVYAIAYWINIWGDPFLEPREAKGWSTAYSSAEVDSGRSDEIVGGKLIIWAPDSNQGFPTDFGPDGLLFTKDDPTGPIGAGYTVVNLDTSPFTFSLDPEPKIDLLEGSIALHDLSKLSYTDAFEQMWQTISEEYPFTDLKKLDWQAIHDEIAPKVQKAQDDNDPVEFYLAIRDFTWLIPDGHVYVSGNDGGTFSKETGGGLGLGLTELDDGRVIATLVLPDLPAAKAGIQERAEITQYNGMPISDAIDQVQPWSAPFSTEHVRRLQQVRYLTRSEVGTDVTITFKNPGTAEKTVTLTSVAETKSFAATSFYAGLDPMALQVDAKLLDSGLGYIKITDLITDSNLIVRLWERALQFYIQNHIPGVIIDLRQNGGGSGLLADMLPGYFVNEEVPLYQEYYYSHTSGKFEARGAGEKIEPAPFTYDGKIAVLVGPACSSACEGLAYNLQKTGRATVVGQYPSGGLFGEVGAGQYLLPENMSLQAPTGRPVAPDGSIVIENVGVVPDVRVPVDETTVFSTDDVVLKAAEDALLSP